MRLEGADPILSVEMMSTGEVACIGDDIPDAINQNPELMPQNIRFHYKQEIF